MWGLPRHDNQLVTITFQPQVMTCSLITTSQRSAPLALQAYKKITFQELELERLVVLMRLKLDSILLIFLIHVMRVMLLWHVHYVALHCLNALYRLQRRIHQWKIL